MALQWLWACNASEASNMVVILSDKRIIGSNVESAIKSCTRMYSYVCNTICAMNGLRVPAKCGGV
jgi:hypothetical protein